MNILIVEDEFLLANELAERIMQIVPNANILDKLGSVEEAVKWFSKYTCDLLFLDIHLNDGLSFSIFQKVDVHCPVIFTTAYDEYAIKAFEVNSIAYLLKPISDNELKKALGKFAKITAQKNEDIKNLLRYLKKTEDVYLERITLTLGKKQKPMKVIDIAYFMADDKYVFAITKKGEKFFYESTLYYLEEKLNPRFFFRVNRRYIINYDSVLELLGYSKGRILIKLIPKTEEEVIVSREKSKKLKEWLMG